jgi:glycosyltransferase involved in cell wall biosynthesis
MLSIIIPTHNEIKNNFIQQSFKLLSTIKNIEVIVVDTDSTDGTKELAKKYGHKVIETDTNSRAKRLNIGIKAARGEFILLHHPRSLLNQKGIQFLVDHKEVYEWGAFTHTFNLQSPMLKFTSFYSNYIRGKRGIFYLDHCIFCSKYLLDSVGLVPEMDIFEDTALSVKLRERATPTLLPYKSVTSAIRFKKNGFWSQAIKNQILKLKFYIRSDHKSMNKNYEEGLELNSNYKKKDK